MLNKHSPIPLYYQLVEKLSEQIRLGELKPGDQLPSERVMSEDYNISRMTVRQAIGYLIKAGQLVAQQGLGTFVAEPKLAYNPLHLLGFTEEMMLKGEETSSRVLEQVKVVPPVRIATELELTPEQATIKIVRVRLSGETPLLLEIVYLPFSLCAGVETEDLENQSLYTLLETRYGLRLNRAHQTFEATIANDYEAELFGIPKGTGMILLEGVTYTDTGQPVEHFKAIYRGDRFKLVLESRRDPLENENFVEPRMSVVML